MPLPLWTYIHTLLSSGHACQNPPLSFQVIEAAIRTATMPMPGYVFRDGGPIPDSDLKDAQHPELGTAPSIDPATTRTSTSTSSNINTPTSSNASASASNAPSDSHAIATADHELRGAVQKDVEDGEVRDMGWNEKSTKLPTLVGGLPNEELWTLVRRFNKQMYHVKATSDPLLGGLDLNIVDEDEFSPDKLRSNVERLYMTVIIGLMGFGKHVARLRSWREPRRTGAFCAVSDSSVSDVLEAAAHLVCRRMRLHGFLILSCQWYSRL